MSQAALRARDLSVIAPRSGHLILGGLDLTVAPGSVTGIIGESGSGKTTLLRCFLGTIADGLEATGVVELVGDDASLSLLDASRRRLRAIRSRRIAYLAQDPARSLTPTMRVGAALAERLPTTLDRAGRTTAVRELLASVGLPDDDDFVRRHPFALSGGQAQRVALARALAASPDVLLLDEPTTGLDVVTQAELLDELRHQHERAPRTTVIVSHDLAVVARLADDIIVLRDGSVVEAGPCRATLRRPGHPYTRQLVDACPDPMNQLDDRTGLVESCPQPPAAGEPDTRVERPVLRVSGLGATHRRRRHGPVVAANGLDLDLRAGACVALVGASGTGKSTIARSIVGAHVPDAGTIALGGRPLPARLDDRTAIDRWGIQLVPQDPTSSLDPRRRVGRSVGDVVRRCRTQPGRGTGNGDVDDAVARLFGEVGLDITLAERRPGALSGGERQRVAIARALAASPEVLICDEVTSALDVSVQAGVVRLLRSLVDDQGLAMLFITHDLGLVHDIADDVAVLHDGRVCEAGPVETVVHAPQHPTTKTLVAASPSLSVELAAPRLSSTRRRRRSGGGGGSPR